ncbi:MAG: glutamate racemase [Lachnospiraceae bacterium]
MKIGFFDSGIGGLSVLHQALQVLPREDYIFYADTNHVPYGEKTNAQIVEYTNQAFDFLCSHGAKVIVIACNTATSVAAPLMRQKYDLPIIGMEPAVRLAFKTPKHKRILVTATPVTIREEKLRHLVEQVDANKEVDLLALPGLVHFAECQKFDTPEVYQYLREQLSPYQLEQFSSLVLGCTHFNYFKNVFHDIMPNGINYIDGCGGTVRQLWKILEEKNLLENNTGKVDYYFSGEPANESQLRLIQTLHTRLEAVQYLH